ncbi:hypothetical protein QC762_609960 [Podospora pseudocomata]|uniref:Uncharacterized protein n=1 Tax=Podospora pseudocomata TaxID=2093779 RepID=A0ABR0G978_9PEZI|nr:hypothetical protein QC762_609960 [Podospora pseudocomata]
MVDTMASSSPLTMESIKSSLSEQDLSKAQEVVTLLLDIYKTLVHMQYILASDLRPGPHDLTAMLPLYQDLQLDPRIIYLYTLLPYIDNHDRAAFYKGGILIDYRNKHHVEEARDPFFHTDDRRAMMRPWMTPLSLCCGLQVVLIYDAKRHVVGVFEQCFLESRDPAMVDKAANSLPWAEDLRRACEEDSHPRLGCGEKGGNVYDNMPARDAADVLRDIKKQYELLEDAPWRHECGEGGGPWPEGVEALFHKHGWPGSDFDVEGFHVDRIRMNAVEGTKRYASEALKKMEREKNGLQRLNQEMLECEQTLALADTLDKEWMTRFEVWKLESTIELKKKLLEGAEKLVARLYPQGSNPGDMPEDVILWELRHLMNAFRQAGGSLETIQTERIIKDNERHLERLWQAVQACLRDADRLCPEREELPRDDNDIKVVAYAFNREWQVGNLTARKVKLQGFLATIPSTCKEGREVVQKEIDNCQRDIDNRNKFWDEADARQAEARKRNEATAAAV